MAEADPNLSLAYLDDVRDHLTEVLLSQKGVSKVAILFDEDDGRLNWQHVGERPTKEQ